MEIIPGPFHTWTVCDGQQVLATTGSEAVARLIVAGDLLADVASDLLQVLEIEGRVEIKYNGPWHRRVQAALAPARPGHPLL